MKHFLILLVLISSAQILAQEKYKKSLILMGSRFDISVIANSKERGEDYIQIAIDEISRIEKIISSWDANSQTSLINKNAGLTAGIISFGIKFVQ